MTREVSEQAIGQELRGVFGLRQPDGDPVLVEHLLDADTLLARACLVERLEENGSHVSLSTGSACRSHLFLDVFNEARDFGAGLQFVGGFGHNLLCFGQHLLHFAVGQLPGRGGVATSRGVVTQGLAELGGSKGAQHCLERNLELLAGGLSLLQFLSGVVAENLFQLSRCLIGARLGSLKVLGDGVGVDKQRRHLFALCCGLFLNGLGEVFRAGLRHLVLCEIQNGRSLAGSNGGPAHFDCLGSDGQ